jgi:hypothetical protein
MLLVLGIATHLALAALTYRLCFASEDRFFGSFRLAFLTLATWPLWLLLFVADQVPKSDK